MTRYVIEGAQVFDGEQPIGVRTVEIEGARIVAIGAPTPATAERIDGTGATLLPGLIDAHTHADVETLGQALRFGVTTEFDLFSFPHTMHPVRRAAAERTDIADVRSSSVGLTAPGGHPTQLHSGLNDPELPTVTRPEDAAHFVDERIAEGADYIKVLIESGKTLGKTVPVVEERIVKAAVAAAHDRDRIVIAHALTLDATWQALTAGVDGFAHLFIDGPATPELIEAFRAGGAFLTPTLNLLASLTGRHLGADLAGDSRVAARLPQPWMDNLSREFTTLPAGNFDDALAAVKAMHEAGVPILAGSDANHHFGALGMAHGASLHGELQLLVRAGLTPTEALRAATSVPATTFGLHDRGRIAPGTRADLLLVDGDPTSRISDTLSIRDVWRGGIRAVQ
ncbi:amidohydrolase family protein [Amycolatopsis sp. NPDC049252]|uniref:amidohydrolase family protein n=1 Tax=Amycolatopsis sp. NPDC049252 TaxID=3363933 RepID=UPI003714D602